MMKRKKKQIRVDFFGEEIRTPRAHEAVSAILSGIKSGNIPLKPVEMGGHTYELRELEQVGIAYQGVIGMFRQDDLPKIGKIGVPLDTTDEHDIPMREDEGLIEKTHFVYYEQPPILLMQLNREGPGVNILARYLADIAKERLSFHPVLRRDAYERMLSDDMHAKEISVKVACPRGVNVLKEGIESDKGAEFLKEILHLMSSRRAATLTLTLQGGMGKTAQHSLGGGVKSGMAAIFNNFKGTEMLERAKLKLVNDYGEVHPVDLIEDRLFTKISVEMEDRYPNKTAIFREMMRSKDTVREDLEAYFQQND